MSYTFNPFISNLDFYKEPTGNALEWFDDGSFIRVVSKGQILFKQRKSDSQTLIPYGMDTDVDLTNIT